MISVTDLCDYLWCPYLVYLKKVRRIKVPPTPAMVRGTVLHKVREDLQRRERVVLLNTLEPSTPFADIQSMLFSNGYQCAKNAVLRYRSRLEKAGIDPIELMSFLKQELKLESIVRAARIKRAVAATDVRTAIDLVVPDQRAEEMVEDQALGLRGRIDKIDERRSGPIPVDYKTGAYYDDPPEGQKVQLYAYALLLERQRGCSVPFGIIEYTSIDRQVPVLIGEDEKRYVLTLLDDVKRIVERKEEPKEEEIKKEKCGACHFAGQCTYACGF
jgi:CRISPR-associated protein Cas4